MKAKKTRKLKIILYEFFIYAWLIVVICIYAFIGAFAAIKYTGINVIEKEPIYVLETNGINEMEQFLLISQRFARNHKYDVDNYNCVNYSNDLKVIADQLGFNTTYAAGCKKPNDGCHKWLRVTMDFNPEIAQFTDFSDTYKYKWGGDLEND